MRHCYICGQLTDSWYDDTCEICKSEISHVYKPTLNEELEMVDRILWREDNPVDLS